MFTRSMSHKEVELDSYSNSKFAELTEKFAKELKEELLSNNTDNVTNKSGPTTRN